MKFIVFGPTSSTGLSEDTFTIISALSFLKKEVFVLSTTKNNVIIEKCVLKNDELKLNEIQINTFLNLLIEEYIVICVGAIAWTNAYYESYKAIFNNAKRKIAYVAVEAELDLSLREYLKSFDDILCNSHFMKKHLDECSRNEVSVNVIPPFVNLKFKRELPNSLKNQIADSKFVLSVADYKSRPKRKGFDIILRAFKELSLEYEELKFILKTYAMPKDEEVRIKEEVSSKNFILINNDFTKNQILTLIEKSHIYFSPHRSEGFGRIIAEAMGLGSLVLASKFSGNLDFMNKKNSFFINGNIVKIKKSEYTSINNGAIWFEPNFHDCLVKLRSCINMSEIKRKNITSTAVSDIRRDFKLSRSAKKLSIIF